MAMKTHSTWTFKVGILAVFIMFPRICLGDGFFPRDAVIEGFGDVKWGTGEKEAVALISDMYFDHYLMPAGDQAPSKIYLRWKSDAKIGNVTFKRIEYWFRENYFYKVTACFESHYGPRTLMTDAERDFEKLRKEIDLQYGEPREYKIGFGFNIFDKRATWHVGRTTILLLYNDGIKPNESRLSLEIKSD
jgi:hypothetical protein